MQCAAASNMLFTMYKTIPSVLIKRKRNPSVTSAPNDQKDIHLLENKNKLTHVLTRRRVR